MKILEKIKVGGHIFKILFPYCFQETGGSISAHTNFLRAEIMIGEDDGDGNKKAQSRIEEDFWHEVIHCITKVYCCNSLTEEQIIGLGQGLHQVLTDNFIIRPKEK